MVVLMQIVALELLAVGLGKGSLLMVVGRVLPTATYAVALLAP